MKLPRFTIFGMMMLIVLVAANFAVVRYVDLQTDTNMTLDFGFIVLPSANLLALLAAKSGRQIARTGKVGSFLLGFEAVGIPLCLIVALATIFTVESIEPYLRLPDRLTGHWVSLTCLALATSKVRTQMIAGYILCFGWLTIVSAAPQLAIASLGGWICKALGLTLVRRGSRERQSPTLVEAPR